MLKKFVILFFLISITFASENVRLGKTKNISSLSLLKTSKNYSSASNVKNVTLNVEADDLNLYKTDQNFELFKINGLRTAGKAGEPTSYIKSELIKLPVNARVTGVKLVEGKYKEMLNPINLAPRKKPYTWNQKNKTDFMLKKDESIYNRDEYFPNKTVTFITGRDSKNTLVYVQFYPVQYNPVQKKAIIITRANIEISYEIETGSEQNKTSKLSTNAENIILTTADLAVQADSLKSMHELMESTSTAIILTDSIDLNYDAASEPSQPGYANISSNPVNANYNYELAKKITSFLLDEAAHPNLKSITILGDARVVPPSYYFYQDWDDDYNNWIVSDLFYASPDYDMVMNFEVGRLPVSTVSQAEQMVQKIKNWKINLTEDWFNNVQLVGGIPFDTPKLYGELITLDPVNRDYLKGKNIEKNFASNGKETTNNVLPHFSDENTGMIYHIGHGSGSTIYLDGYDNISFSDINSLPAATKYPAVISIACMNGGYDAELMSNSNFSNCFAEGVMRSLAGGIAYWGGTRSNSGTPQVMYKDNGELIVGDESYMAKMLTNCFKAYSEGNLRMGEITKEAFSEFMETFNDGDVTDFVTAYAFVFFGDPVLSLLPNSESAYENVVYDVDPLPIIPGSGNNIPVYYKTSDFSIPLNITANTNSPSVNIKIYDVTENYYISLSELVNETDDTYPLSYTFTPPSENTYLTCYETSDFKETRLYFQVEEVEYLPPLASQLNEICSDGEGNYDISWTPSMDYDGEIISYTLREMKDQIAASDTCNGFEMWNNNGFTVAENGHDGTPCFYSGSGDDLSHAIQTSMPALISEGDQLTFSTYFDIEEDWDYAYIELSTNGQDYISLDVFTGNNYSWTEKTYDLSEYEGQQVVFRFRYETDGAVVNEGFYVDNISPVGWFEEITLIKNIIDTTYHAEGNTGDYFYQVKAIDNDTISSAWSNMQQVNTPTGISSVENTPKTWTLEQNYPNPFNPTTTITYNVPKSSMVNLAVFNMLGQKVRTLINTQNEIGIYNVTWDGKNNAGIQVPSGIYFYRLKAGSYQKTNKMLLMK